LNPRGQIISSDLAAGIRKLVGEIESKISWKRFTRLIIEARMLYQRQKAKQKKKREGSRSGTGS